MIETLVFERDAEAAANAVMADSDGLEWTVQSEGQLEVYCNQAQFMLRAETPSYGEMRIVRNPHGPNSEFRWVFAFGSLDVFHATADSLAELLSIPGMIDAISGRIGSLPEIEEPRRTWRDYVDFKWFRISFVHLRF